MRHVFSMFPVELSVFRMTKTQHFPHLRLKSHIHYVDRGKVMSRGEGSGEGTHTTSHGEGAHATSLSDTLDPYHHMTYKFFCCIWLCSQREKKKETKK
jgi:hypothetical protein